MIQHKISTVPLSQLDESFLDRFKHIKVFIDGNGKLSAYHSGLELHFTTISNEALFKQYVAGLDQKLSETNSDYRDVVEVILSYDPESYEVHLITECSANKMINEDYDLNFVFVDGEYRRHSELITDDLTAVKIFSEALKQLIKVGGWNHEIKVGKFKSNEIIAFDGGREINISNIDEYFPLFNETWNRNPDGGVVLCYAKNGGNSVLKLFSMIKDHEIEAFKALIEQPDLPHGVVRASYATEVFKSPVAWF